MGWMTLLCRAAVEGALTHCKKSGGGKTKYEVNAVEDAIVEGHSQVELAGTIEAYQLEVSGSKTTSKSMTAHKTENKSHRQD